MEEKVPKQYILKIKLVSYFFSPKTNGIIFFIAKKYGIISSFQDPRSMLVIHDNILFYCAARNSSLTSPSPRSSSGTHAMGVQRSGALVLQDPAAPLAADVTVKHIKDW